MDFTLNSDQSAIADALDKLAAQFTTVPTEFHGFALVGEELERELEAGQYFDIAAIPELGTLAAALAVERLARLPCTAEIALSMLLRPQLDIELPRPFALVENGRPGRFLVGAGTVIVIDGENIGIAHPAPDEVAPVESLYAYPMGRLTGRPAVRPLAADEAATVRTWLRVACAAEIAGLMQAAIDATVEHLGVRKQFGRPLGTFQALRHRMAECAVLAGGDIELVHRAEPGPAQKAGGAYQRGWRSRPRGRAMPATPRSPRCMRRTVPPVSSTTFTR